MRGRRADRQSRCCIGGWLLTDPVEDQARQGGFASLLRDSITPGLAIVADLLAVITVLVVGTGVQGVRLVAVTLGTVTAVAAAGYIIAARKRSSRRTRWAGSVALMGIVSLCIGLFVPPSAGSRVDIPNSTAPSSSSSYSMTPSSVHNESSLALKFLVMGPSLDTGWTSRMSIGPNLRVTLLVEYKNVTSSRQDNVLLKVSLPEGLTYDAGSSLLGHALHPDGTRTSDGLTTTGINVGSYQPGGNAWVVFTANVGSTEEFPCLLRTLSPLATAVDGAGSRSAEVTIIVKRREC